MNHVHAPRTVWLGCIISVFASTATGCGPSDRTPTGAVELFLQAVLMEQQQRVYELLHPGDQQQLTKLAQQANAQAGGGRRFEPHQMLDIGRSIIGQGRGKLTVVEQKAGRALVQVHGAKGKSSTRLSVIKVDRRWRIKLPKALWEVAR